MKIDNNNNMFTLLKSFILFYLYLLIKNHTKEKNNISVSATSPFPKSRFFLFVNSKFLTIG